MSRADASPPGSGPRTRRAVHPRGLVLACGLLVSLLVQLLVLEEESLPVDEVALEEGASATDEAPPPAPAETLTLAFAGDIHFEGSLRALARDSEATLGELSERLAEADLAIVNLESPVTRRRSPAAKELEDPERRYWFRSPPGAFGVLERSGVDVAVLANNHAGDHGVRGLVDTLRAARRSEVTVVGIGRDDAEAFAPVRATIRGSEVAVLAADASPLESEDPLWTVRPGSGPGIASARRGDTDRLLAAVREAAAMSDLVVVYLHWGREGSYCPTRFQQRLAGDLAEAGADIVVGSHAHLLQGAGLLSGTYVGYGLGNFLWYHGRESETGVLQLTVAGDEVVEDVWHPGRIPAEGGAPRALGGERRTEAIADWHALRTCTDLADGPGRTPPAGEERLPEFTAAVRSIDASIRERMRGSHDPARCPVPLEELRLLTPAYVGFDGRAYRGELILHEDVVDDVREIFADLYEARFPIERMQLVGDYDGDDDSSMAANNTSGYNCRPVAGTLRWSDHAYGRAVDINPVQNPYLTGGEVLPPAGADYQGVDRGPDAPPSPGVIREGDVVHRAFTERGWTWGGAWTEPDYQHFSAP